DPSRYDGILLPFTPVKARSGIVRVLEERASFHEITMAEATLNDGQRMLAVNDFLVGQRTHVSARYSLCWRGQTERQSSSGLLVSPGAGWTGWFTPAQHMAAAVTRMLWHERAPDIPRLRLAWNAPRLAFVVREPFVSCSSSAKLTAGLLES